MRGKERISQKEFSTIEIRIGFECSESGCDWKMVSTNPNQKPPELYEELPVFGKHNVEKHGGSIGVHMNPVTKTKRIFSR